MRADPEYSRKEGWKLHLTIGPVAYDQRARAVFGWLDKNFSSRRYWKHLSGGDRHEKDFTIYLGSYATMMSVVRRLENDPTIQQLDACNAGSADRIVGDTGKIGARFTTNGFQIKGKNGIPVADDDVSAVLTRGEALNMAIERSKASLRKKFGDYFLPMGIE